MKDKILGEIKRGENDIKPHSNSVISSFHADAPTFQPRNAFLVSNGINNSVSNSNPVIQSNSNSNNSLSNDSGIPNNEISSGLTATAQPFIPSSIRHNTSSVLESVDHGFHIPSNTGVVGGTMNIGLGGISGNSNGNNISNAVGRNSGKGTGNNSNNYSSLAQINGHLNSASLHVKHGIMYSGGATGSMQEGTNLPHHHHHKNHGGGYNGGGMELLVVNGGASAGAVGGNSNTGGNNINSGIGGSANITGSSSSVNEEGVIGTGGGAIHVPGIEYDGIILGSSCSSSIQNHTLSNTGNISGSNSGIIVDESGQQNIGGVPGIQYSTNGSGGSGGNIVNIGGSDSVSYYGADSGEGTTTHHLGMGVNASQTAHSHNHHQHQQHGMMGNSIGILNGGLGQGQVSGMGGVVTGSGGAFQSSNANNNSNQQSGNVLELSEYCRRVRGWNLPFLRMIPQMNAITQIRHELQLQNISLLLTQNDIISMGTGMGGGHSGSAAIGVHTNNGNSSGNNSNDNCNNANHNNSNAGNSSVHHHTNSGTGQSTGQIQGGGSSSQILMNQQHQHYVPQIIQRNYYSLCLLDDSNILSTTRFCGYQTYAYKAINIEDYTAYCLRRIDNYPFSELENTRHCLERWHKLTQHPCIVSYRQCFASLDFPQGALVVVYDYIPNASTMESVHFKEPIGEPLLWNYIIQIVLALVHIHSSQLAARVIDPTKLLISYRGRLRLNCVGILDFTRIDESKTVVDYQKQDLVALGYIILALCCGSLTIINDLNHAVEQIFLKSSMYSNDLKKLVLILLSKPALNKNNLDVFILANMLAARMIPQIEHSLKLTDALENEFRKEIDNGRLFRLLTKINTIADRSQLNSVHKWNETGDRYICKLFREYLFQQTDSQGRPVVDMGHILDSLAKVDVGTSETVTLMSSDGSSILLVSFADIKHSIEKSFCEIIASTTTNSNFNDL